MGWGLLSDRQLNAIKPFIAGLEVHDLGAGDLLLSHILLAAGADRVMAVDKHPDYPGSVISKGKKISRVNKCFDQYRGDIDVAFVSWPINGPTPGLVECVGRAKTLIYLGKNTDGSLCGTREFYHHMLHRALLVHIPERQNTLVVVGSRLHRMRTGTYEERAGFDTDNEYPWRGRKARDKRPGHAHGPATASRSS